MVNWSIVDILNLSIAHRHLHKLASLMVLALVTLWELGPCHRKLIHVRFRLFWHHVVGADFFLHATETGVAVHGLLGDWDHGVNNVPKDALDERSGCQ